MFHIKRKEVKYEKKNLILVMMLLLSLSLAACGTTQQSTTETTTETTTESTENTESTESTEAAALELTLEELAKYNGQDGNPAYIAVDGVIYDVTDSPAWTNGGHNGFEAGQDLTDAIKNQSPHGVSMLEGLPVVGKLVS